MFADQVTISTDKVNGIDCLFVMPGRKDGKVGYLPAAHKATLRSHSIRFDWDLKCYKGRLSDAALQVAKDVKSQVENYVAPTKAKTEKVAPAPVPAPVQDLVAQAKGLLEMGFTKAQVAKMIGDMTAAK